MLKMAVNVFSTVPYFTVINVDFDLYFGCSQFL